jgi:outer membrane protein TolC
LLAVSGCTTVRQARLAQQDEGRLDGERTLSALDAGIRLTPNDSQTVAAPDAAPMSLAELEKIAVRSSPDVAQARQALLSAELSLREVKADYRPSISATAGYTRATSNTDRHHQSTSLSGRFDGSVELDLLLADFGKTDAAVRDAVSRVVAARWDLVSRQNQVVYNVRTAFYTLTRARELAVVADMTVEQYKEHMNQTLARKEGGTATNYDYTKARVDWNNAVLDSLTSHNNVNNAWADLNFALGLAEKSEYALGDGALPEMGLEVDALYGEAKASSPELASLQAQVRAASSYVDQTIAELYPTLSANLTTSVSGGSLGLPMLWNLSGAGSLVQKVFDGGKNRLAIEQAVTQLRIARAELAAREQALFRDIRQAVLAIEHARKQFEVAQATERQAQENLDNVNEMFRVGKASSLERTDAQVSLSTAQAKVVTAKFDHLDSQAKLCYLVGR